jgi:hypothetical protein
MAVVAFETAREWIGERLDDVVGAKVGRVMGLYLDIETREPLWMIVRLGRREQYAAVPLDQATEGGGRVWVPYERERIRSAAHLVTNRPLAPAYERELCGHYGVGLTRGAMAAAWERRTCAFAVGDIEDPGVRDAVESTQWRGEERRQPGGAPRPETAAA